MYLGFFCFCFFLGGGGCLFHLLGSQPFSVILNQTFLQRQTYINAFKLAIESR